MLALIAGTVSYLHMHLLVEMHGQPGWVAALTPLSVDGMIVAASTTLLAESRGGSRGGFLPWALLVIGSAASLAANVAVAEPTSTGRVIAAWPSFSLIAAYKLLMRQVRRVAESTAPRRMSRRPPGPATRAAVATASGPVAARAAVTPQRPAALNARLDAWQWAQDNRAGDGSLPSGREIGSGTVDTNAGGGGWSNDPGSLVSSVPDSGGKGLRIPAQDVRFGRRQMRAFGPKMCAIMLGMTKRRWTMVGG